MGWELVKDTKNVKCWLNLDEIKKRGNRYSWKNSIGKKFGVRLQWCNDKTEEKNFLIVDYFIDKNGDSKMIIEDIDYCKLHEVYIENLKSGQFSVIFGKMSNVFKYDINDEINNLKIINREYRNKKNNKNEKWYQYQCLKCGNIDWIVECSLKNGNGCNLCGRYPRKIKKGYNDISTTHPHLCKYFVNIEDSYIYAKGSHEKIKMKCPFCKHTKEMTIYHLIDNGFSCPICGDGFSYPEKFMANILTQLNIKFITQLNHTVFKWCDKYFYDFYLPDYNMIIETHGEQHYWYLDDKKKYKKIVNGKNGIEEHENDIIKYDIAVLNGFECNKNYFVIDSRESTLEWMKKNIIETLGHIFDLSDVDWETVDLESQKSIMKQCIKMWNSGEYKTAKEVADVMNISATTVCRYLNKGNEANLCYYNGDESRLSVTKGKRQSDDLRKKHSEMMKDKPHSDSPLIVKFDLNGVLLDIKYNFQYKECNRSSISAVCQWYKCNENLEEFHKIRKGYPLKRIKGYIFKYISDVSDEQINDYIIRTKQIPLDRE